MRSASDLIGQPALDLSTGKEIGKINSLFVDLARRGIGAFELNTGLLRPASFVVWRDVVNIGPDALTIPSTDALLGRREALDGATFDNGLHDRPVFSPNGERLGKVVDYRIDVESGAVTGLDVEPEHASRGLFGLGKAQTAFIPIDQIDTLGEETIIARYVGVGS
jgi:sporulation protein YlmC with PRC-barrel domain